jgi:2-keto-3-deoxy-L-rhamnonate aldolase RhmA
MYAVEAGGSTPMIRLGDGSAPNVLKACDVGCQGILVAHVQTAQEAAGIVRAMRFHPDGDRGMAPFTRLHDWSSDELAQKLADANRWQLAGILVEDSVGLQRRILQVQAWISLSGHPTSQAVGYRAGGSSDSAGHGLLGSGAHQRGRRGRRGDVA